MKTLSHSAKEAALMKVGMLAQNPKVWSPNDLEKEGGCQQKALMKQTRDTELNSLVF